MRLGILADTHGQVVRTRQAIERLAAAGAEAFVHCGDVGGPEVLAEFAGRRLWFVWGNTDYPDPTWRAELDALGLPWPAGPLNLLLDDRRVAVFHGHERGFRRAVESNENDYVLCGHSHMRTDRRIGRTRLINPGALHRAGLHTVALLDLRTDELLYIQVD